MVERAEQTTLQDPETPLALPERVNNQLALRMIFAAPESLEDDIFADAIEDVDIVCFANRSYDKRTIDTYRQASEGTLPPRKMKPRRFFKSKEMGTLSSLETELQILFNTRKDVRFLGPNKHHPLSLKLQALENAPECVFDATLFLEYPFLTTIQLARSYFSKHGEIQRAIMQYTARQITHLHEEISFPGSHAPKNVLITVPQTHLPIVDLFDKPEEFAYSYQEFEHEAFLTQASNKAIANTNIDKTLAARALLEIWAAESYSPPRGSKNSEGYLIRNATSLAASLEFHEIEVIFERVRKKQSNSTFVRTLDFANAIDHVLTVKAGGEVIPHYIPKIPEFNMFDINNWMR